MYHRQRVKLTVSVSRVVGQMKPRFVYVVAKC